MNIGKFSMLRYKWIGDSIGAKLLGTARANVSLIRVEELCLIRLIYSMKTHDDSNRTPQFGSVSKTTDYGDTRNFGALPM